MRKRMIAAVLPLSLLLTVSAFAADRINITEAPYNAIPNDAGDDSAAIRAAVNAGHSIYFPPGTYKFTGTLSLPSQSAFRLYGDGPGVSVIQFFAGPSGGAAGISAADMGQNTLNVEGLTLKAMSYNCGRAIYASFNGVASGIAPMFRSATIHNVQIVGSTVTGATGGYWTEGIHLNKAQNAVIDKLEINGNNRSEDGGPPTQFGIIWESPNNYRTRGLQLSQLEFHYCNTALQTNGWVQDLFLNNFEFVLCGQFNMPAVDLNTSDATRQSVFHIANGHVNLLQQGMRVTRVRDFKISNVFFFHWTGDQFAGSGDHLVLQSCTGAVISQNTFNAPLGDVPSSNGINLLDSHDVRVEGNYFRDMKPGTSGSCVVVPSTCSLVRIVNNIFDNVRQQYADDRSNIDTYYRSNWPN